MLNSYRQLLVCVAVFSIPSSFTFAGLFTTSSSYAYSVSDVSGSAPGSQSSIQLPANLSTRVSAGGQGYAGSSHSDLFINAFGNLFEFSGSAGSKTEGSVGDEFLSRSAFYASINFTISETVLAEFNGSRSENDLASYSYFHIYEQITGRYKLLSSESSTSVTLAPGDYEFFIYGRNESSIQSGSSMAQCQVKGQVTFSAVPEPTSLSLVGLAGLATISTRRRRRLQFDRK